MSSFELRLPMMPISSVGRLKLAGILEQVMAMPVRPTLVGSCHSEQISIQRPQALQRTCTLGVNRIRQVRT